MIKYGIDGQYTTSSHKQLREKRLAEKFEFKMTLSQIEKYHFLIPQLFTPPDVSNKCESLIEFNEVEFLVFFENSIE